MGYLAAARAYKVPRSTLFRLCNTEGPPATVSKTKLGKRPILSAELEEELVRYLLIMDQKFFGLTRRDVRSLAFQLAKQEEFAAEMQKENQNLPNNNTRAHNEQNNSPNVYPSDIVPVPELTKKLATRGRKCGRTKIITSTPNKEELEQSINLSKQKVIRNVFDEPGPSGLKNKKPSVYLQLKTSTQEDIEKTIWTSTFSSFAKTFQARKVPSSTEEWKEISKRFEEVWNFPYCVGAIDGKHVLLQAPMKSGSDFFNYKSQFSIVLMAVVDADYNFTFVDIGCQGRISDGAMEADDIPDDILEAANAATLDIFSTKSKERYEEEHGNFEKWCYSKNVSSTKEEAFLAYSANIAKRFLSSPPAAAASPVLPSVPRYYLRVSTLYAARIRPQPGRSSGLRGQGDILAAADSQRNAASGGTAAAAPHLRPVADHTFEGADIRSVPTPALFIPFNP
ncbi:unnamed protein product [Acanthoscelides obtectus]|uniref:DDE Tnp4 domain-containing protein n=1 Tax=Acanthoscelides obtectus TaxID=200917 RepID=A0A9P0L4T6_ACAOB|nr:unnamed protein product [Acanthoscelides obtectus]CAK1663284.1 hypothetical protein AOBTE_LOCUS23593 [Acanthoscelides obtectus]